MRTAQIFDNTLMFPESSFSFNIQVCPETSQVIIWRCLKSTASTTTDALNTQPQTVKVSLGTKKIYRPCWRSTIGLTSRGQMWPCTREKVHESPVLRTVHVPDIMAPRPSAWTNMMVRCCLIDIIKQHVASRGAKNKTHRHTQSFTAAVM